MAVHEIPRNVKGEGRFLYIFTTKSLIFTAIFAVVGLGVYYIFNTFLKMKLAGIIGLVICAGIGFGIATLKMPDSENFAITRKTGGEKIDEVILRAIKFKLKHNRIYVHKKGGTK